MDILIKNALLLTMTGKGVGAIPDGFMRISGNKITAVGPMSEMPVTAAVDRVKVIDARGKVVMPGLIDGHIHAMLTLFRGLAQDMDDWMHYGLAPYLSNMAEAAAISGAALAAVEALKNGTTTLVDFGFPMPSICRVYEEIGLRARVASLITAVPIQMEDLPPGELYPFDETQGELLFYQNLALIEEWHNKAGGRITCMLGPQGPDMIPRELLLRIKQAAEDLGVMIHMHVAQGDRETYQIAKRFNCRSIPYLHQLGLIDKKLLAIHLTEATEDEVATMAENGAAMVCCPASIAIIDGIVPPLVSFLEHGGRAALGSDQAPGNNSHNLWNEMKLAALLNKVRYRDPKVLPAWKALRLATIEGARAVGLGDQVGSLEPGKLADVIIVDLQQPGLVPHLEYPVRNVVPNLVYAARGHEVETVIIDGRMVIENRRLLTMDEEAIVSQAQEAARSCAAESAAKILALNKGPAAMMHDGLI